MKSLYKTFALSFAFILLAGCGEDEGGEAKVTGEAVLSVADCGGSDCGVNGNNYAGSGIGVWRYTNDQTGSVSLNISLSNVHNRNITVVFTNEKSSSVYFPSNAMSGIKGKFLENEIAPQATDLYISHFNDIPDHIRYFDKQEMLRKAATSSSQKFSIKAPMFKDWSEGTSKVWYVAPKGTMLSRNATLKKKLTAGDGRIVNFWVENAEFGSGKVTQTILDNISRRFTDDIYSNVVSIAGAPWGTYNNSDYGALIESSQSVNVVFTNLGNNGAASGMIGYFWPLNNLLAPVDYKYKYEYQCDPCTNEALVFFADTEMLYLHKNGTNIMLSTLAHELTHMINFYQRGISMSEEDAYDTFLDELTAIMMEDIIGKKIANGFNDVRNSNYINWLKSALYNCDFTDWNNCNSQNVYSYHTAGSFGAYMLRHYGIGFYQELLKYPVPRPLSINDRQNSIALLDNAIKTKTYNTEGLGRAVQRWGAGIALFPAASSPSGFGYPEKIDGSFYLSAFDGDSFKSIRKLPTSQPSTLKGYGHYPVERRVTTYQYEETVIVPSGVSVTVIVK